jgi:hypothetical protein
VPERLQVDADEIEAAAADFAEMALLEARFGRILPDRVVAEDVDAPVEDRRRGGRGGCGGRGERQEQRKRRGGKPLEHRKALLIRRGAPAP